VISIRGFLTLLATLLVSLGTCAQQPNDNFSNRIPVEPFVPFYGSVTGATFEPFDPLATYHIPVSGGKGSVWWSWTPPSTGFAAIVDTRNENPSLTFEALAVYEGGDLATIHDPVWTYVGRSLEPRIYEPKPFLGFLTVAGSPVSIGLVGEASVESGHNFLLTFSETPIITEPPASRTNYAGGAVAFHFVSPSYRFGRTQWQFNSQNITNATNAVLFLADIRPSHAGQYRVVIEAPDSEGIWKRTISPSATLTVLGDVIPPALSFETSADSPADLLLNIFGTTKYWYSIDRTTDFKKWTQVEIGERANTVESGPNLITPLASAEFLRVRHRGDLVQVCVENLREIHFAKELHRLAYQTFTGAATRVDDLKEFLGELPRCPQLVSPQDYTYNTVDTPPTCPWAAAGHVLP
jgi:hypothetical protein